MTRYRDRYRIETSRLPGWDYASAGYYFVTICTQNHVPFFGEIINAEMHLAQLGEYASQYWIEIPTHFPHVTLDEYIIMPNHIHGIIAINVETQHAASLPESPINQPSSGSLSAIIRSYKSALTRWAHQNAHPSFAWQPRFYDHIIRDETALDRIRTYVRDNPRRWDQDRENPRNIPHPTP